MHRETIKTRVIWKQTAGLVLLLATVALAMNSAQAATKTAGKRTDDLPGAEADPIVDIELLTWPEIYKAIHEQGKTTAILFDGGTEQRGPQGVTGAHTYIAHATADAIARKLGNALVAPVIPYSVNKANPELPGTIGALDLYSRRSTNRWQSS